MSLTRESTLGRALILSGITGLRCALGPALISTSRRQPGRDALVLAALGEMLVDKIPLVPSRSSLPLLIPRVLAGYWVARQVAEQDRSRDPNIALAGAGAAAAAALLAPTLRALLGSSFRISDTALGALEDALAISLGSKAAGLSREDLLASVTEAINAVRQAVPDLPLPGGLPNAPIPAPPARPVGR